MLGREAAEFGAAWHGSSWTEHTILGKPPWKMASLNASPVEVWEGDDIALDAWKPAYREKGEAKEMSYILILDLRLKRSIGRRTPINQAVTILRWML